MFFTEYSILHCYQCTFATWPKKSTNGGEGEGEGEYDSLSAHIQDLIKSADGQLYLQPPTLKHFEHRPQQHVGGMGTRKRPIVSQWESMFVSSQAPEWRGG